MKIAVLVLANDKPVVLRQSLKIFIKLGWSVFVHVDARIDIESYKVPLRETSRYVYWLTTRHKIFWGGYSMIAATFSLIKSTQFGYDRYILLSDDTLPIASISELSSAVQINIDRIDRKLAVPGDGFFERYHNFFYFDSECTSPIARPLVERSIDPSLLQATEDIKMLQNNGKLQLDVYYGSQWWVLTKKNSGEYFE